MTPLVFAIGSKTWAWVENGILYLTSGGPWSVVADWEPAPGMGGRVLTESELNLLLTTVGRPTK